MTSIIKAYLPCNESVVILLTNELPAADDVWLWDELLISTDFVGFAPEEELSVEVPAEEAWSPISEASFDELEDGCVARMIIFCAGDVFTGRVAEATVVMTGALDTSTLSFETVVTSDLALDLPGDPSQDSPSVALGLVVFGFLLQGNQLLCNN